LILAANLDQLPEQERVAWVGQAKLLKARLDIRNGKKQQLEERIGQLAQAISGLGAELQSTKHQAELVDQELQALLILKKSDLVAMPRVLDRQRESERLAGESGRLSAEIARTKVQIGETRLEVLEVDHAALQEVLTELRDVEAKVVEGEER